MVFLSSLTALCAPKRREYEEKPYDDQDAAASFLTHYQNPPDLSLTMV